MSDFKHLVQEQAEASVIKLDIWEIKLSLDKKEGSIVQIS